MHTYAAPASASSDSRVERLEKQLAELKVELKGTMKELSYFTICHSQETITMLTGLPSAEIFELLSDLLNRFKLKYYSTWRVANVHYHNQLLLTLMKLKLNSPFLDLGHRFGISRTTASNIFHTYLNALYEILSQKLILMPSRFKNQACLPQSFDGFNNCRVVLDCTEVPIEIPKNMFEQNVTYSSYKGRNTFKALVGVAPNGTITFISNLYPGSVSDKEIVIQSKVLEKLVPGDMVMADKGFLLHDIMPPGTSLNIPPFLHGGQFSLEQVNSTYNIARARIHVERAICRIKIYQILNLIPNSLRAEASMIFKVCAALVNWQSPLIASVKDMMVE